MSDNDGLPTPPDVEARREAAWLREAAEGLQHELSRALAENVRITEEADAIWSEVLRLRSEAETSGEAFSAKVLQLDEARDEVDSLRARLAACEAESDRRGREYLKSALQLADSDSEVMRLRSEDETLRAKALRIESGTEAVPADFARSRSAVAVKPSLPELFRVQFSPRRGMWTAWGEVGYKHLGMCKHEALGRLVAHECDLRKSIDIAVVWHPADDDESGAKS